MTKLALNEATLAKFRDVKQRVEICDEEGRIVGYFEPSIYAGQVIPPEPTEEELEESEAEESYTLAEVLDYLKGLEKQ
ncbi:MAG TPA: hypothetical protein VFG68_06430 [Fimbriiglobus sp.]|nr:hypothetical protein [Fimbriiglobus sp.]